MTTVNRHNENICSWVQAAVGVHDTLQAVDSLLSFPLVVKWERNHCKRATCSLSSMRGWPHSHVISSHHIITHVMLKILVCKLAFPVLFIRPWIRTERIACSQWFLSRFATKADKRRESPTCRVCSWLML